MTEIPEHLRKRAEAAKAKAQGTTDAPSGEAAPGGGAPAADEKIPSHLLDRGTAAADQPGTVAGGPVAPAGSSGPDGHNQRLLTVVKSGSIQDTKATPQDKVHVWPHLLLAEFLAALAITLFSLLFSIFVNAPLLELADFNKTPNPSKAPWYFLGLQELLTMFHPMVAGVTIPGIGLFVLVMAPYIDKNPSKRPEDRKFAISLMTVHLMFWSVLVMIGSFFRGPGFNFVFPWNSGLFFEL
jgi:quinol-cytochrome oxidoreductase complex cytochrome b subunit